MRWIATLSTHLLKHAPFRCELCAGASAFAWCADCHADMLGNRRNCLQCGLPYAGSGICGQCLRKPPAWERCRFLYPYEFPVHRLIHAFKYRLHSEFAASFAHYFALHALEADEQTWPEILCPMPLHWRRHIQRGYNQAQCLCKSLSAQTKIPCRTDLLHRIRPTALQSQLDRVARRRNIRNAFGIKEQKQQQIQNRHIALVDDVATTGSTAMEAASLLKRKGAARVELWVMARAGH
ncbi:MAG: ComF family protein [Candidatus Eutrophobiaceae bacterium]